MPCTLRFPMPPPGRHSALCLPSLHLPNGTAPTNYAGRCSSFLRPPNRSFTMNRKRQIFVITFLQNRPSILSLLGRKAVPKCYFIVQFTMCFLFVNMSSIICKCVIGIGEAFEETGTKFSKLSSKFPVAFFPPPILRKCSVPFFV
jgi:hypothetical protein